MKDSHGQTEVTLADVRCKHKVWAGDHCYQCAAEAAPTIVQDYRAYTAEEILREIVLWAEQAGWGDPANLGHWLGAAQRWALKERVCSTE